MKLVQLIKQKITRYIFLEAPFLYVLSKEKKNMFKIRSMVNLLFIYRIFVNVKF